MLARFALATICAGPLAAHDMWIEPSNFRPAQGQFIETKLRVGVDFAGDPLPRNPALIDRFFAADAAGERPVIGRPGADPAGLVRVGSAGLTIIGYRSHNSSLEQTAEKFAGYLQEEGLEAIAAARPRRDPAAPVKELFSRCAKSLVLSGPAEPGQADRALGFTLELVAERNPYALGEGGSLPVRITHEGRPLAGTLVVAMNRANPAEKQSARSDRDGRVRFKIEKPGMWLIKTVHLVPAPQGSDAEWASLWASLTFEISGSKPTPAAPQSGM